MNKKVNIKDKILVWTLLTVSALWLASCTDKDDKKVVNNDNTKVEETKKTDDNVQVASSKDTVLVNYTWKLKDWKVFDSSIGKKPFEFVIDWGGVIAWFNEWVKWMKVWEKKTIVIPAKDAYGPAVIEKTIPATLLDPTNEKSPFYGKELKSGVKSDWTNGIPVIEIISVNTADKTVTVKQNNTHPLAWKELTFELELVEIKSNNETSIADKIKNKANAVKDWVNNTVDAAKKTADKVSDTASKTVDAVKDWADKVAETANKVLDTANKATDAVKDWADKVAETVKNTTK